MTNLFNANDYHPSPGSLTGKNILITGATGGLGTALSKAIGGLGGTVILAGRTLKSLEKLYDVLEQEGAPEPAIFPVNLETATQSDYFQLAQTITDELGHLDGLVHCAAELGTPTPIEHYPVATWSSVMQVNVNSAFLLSRCLLPLLNRQNRASIVFTTDQQRSAYWGAYGVSKSALDTLAMILADEIEGMKNDQDETRVAVNLVNPGRMRTKLRQKSFAGELPTETPTPDTRLGPYLYLLTRDDPSVHGQILRGD